MLSIPIKSDFKFCGHSVLIENKTGINPALEQEEQETRAKNGTPNAEGTNTMARFESGDAQFVEMAATNKPEILFELGLIYATGRDGQEDMISAHKWFNIAASQGCVRSRARREEIAAFMSKEEIAKAQRAAREWMTRH